MRRSLSLSVLTATISLGAFSGTLPAGRVFTLRNARVACTVAVEGGHLSGDRVELIGGKGERSPRPAVETDAGFALDLMWSDWRPPGKKNNGENPVMLREGDFTFERSDSASGDRGEKDLVLFFAGPERALFLRVTYRLGKDDFYVRRNVAVMDTSGGETASCAVIPPS
jgi:hypothetical protein